MEKRHSILLAKDQYKSELDFLISYFQQNNVKSVEILFGFFWGNFFGDWDTIIVSPDNITNTISKAEKETGEQFYENDLFIENSKENLSIHFCHEGDIHLSFEGENQLVDTLLERWQELGILRVD